MPRGASLCAFDVTGAGMIPRGNKETSHDHQHI